MMQTERNLINELKEEQQHFVYLMGYLINITTVMNIYAFVLSLFLVPSYFTFVDQVCKTFPLISGIPLLTTHVYIPFR